MKKGLSLVELIIVVAILGILGAIVLPQFQDNAAEARESAAKANLQSLRAAIELYAAQHNGIAPGYPFGDTSIPPHYMAFRFQLVKPTNVKGEFAEPGTAGYPLGPYMSEIPENPFNNRWVLKMLYKTEPLPEEATGTYGWIYKAATKAIRLDWPGTDKAGDSYYDY
ncbi:MAG: type IV pilin protein [Planctomycetota bacterium]|jgi:prepilin-type N-terminal cleavage/methylation domain-containing protein